MRQPQSRRRRGRGDRVLGFPHHNLSQSQHPRRMLDREPNSGSSVIGDLRSKGGFLSTCRSHQFACRKFLERERIENNSRVWVPSCGLTPPVVRKGEIGRGRSTGWPPWSLRSATDRRIVPSSRSPNLERRRLRVSGGPVARREVQTGSMPLLVRVEIAEGVY